MKKKTKLMINIMQEKRKYFLFKVADVLENNNIKFFLSFGTLLGAIREQNFIKWDNDIDIGFKTNYFSNNPELWYKVVKELNEFNITPNVIWYNHASTSMLYKYEVFTDIYKSIPQYYTDTISMDIYYHIKRGDRYYVDLQGLQYFFPDKFISNLGKIDFLGREFNTPLNPEEYLTFMYGKNWSKPKKKAKGTNNRIKRPEIKEIHYKHILPYYKEKEK